MSAALVEQWARGLLGSTLAGRYRLDRLLGVGGMGAVFEGVHLAVQRRVAIKLLLPDRSSDRALVERFQREAQAAAQVGGRGVVEVLDFDRDPQLGAFLVMEFLEGASLGDVLGRVGRLPWEQVVPLGLTLLRTLSRVHGAGIVHRDLKPDNVFLARTEEGTQRVVIVDFGIARMAGVGGASKLTQTGAVVGTPLYMAPEQAQGDGAVDHRADLYSVGAILYEALSGRPPLDAETWPALFLKIFSEPPEPLQQLVPGIPEPVADAVAWALAKKPEERPASAEEMARRLAEVLPPEQRPPWLTGAASSDGFQSTVALDVPLEPREEAELGPAVASSSASRRRPAGSSPAVADGQGAAATTPSGGQWAIRWAAFGVAATLVTVAVTIWVVRGLLAPSAPPPVREPERTAAVAAHRDAGADGARTRERGDAGAPDGGRKDGGLARADGGEASAARDGGRGPRPRASGRDGRRGGGRGPRRGPRGGAVAGGRGDDKGRGSPRAGAASPSEPVAGSGARGGSGAVSPPPGRSTTLPPPPSAGGGPDADEVALLSRRYEQARAALRAGRRREAARLFKDVVDMAWERRMRPGSSGARVAALAGLGWAKALGGLPPVPRRLETPDEWNRALRGAQQRLQRLQRPLTATLRQGHPDLNQCAWFELGRLYERMAAWVNAMPLPERPPNVEEPAPELVAQYQESFSRTKHQLAESYVRTALGYYDQGAQSFGPSGRCRAPAEGAASRLRAQGIESFLRP